MVCPTCNSSGLRKLSLIHATGIHESRGRFCGVFFGNTDGLHFGRYRGKSQTKLSKTVRPPVKAPYSWPIGLWLLGFFTIMTFANRGRISEAVAVLDLACILLLPTYLVAALAYNFFVRPARVKVWQSKFMCQRCGAIV
jgi:hypothetical protein